MKQLQTTGIVLTRTDFGEADRIVTVLTPDSGKLRLMARGVRKVKSRLAGGIELFSISDITYVQGKGEIGTLISARLKKHYGNIVKDINRVQLGYDLIKMLHKATEDETEPEYFVILDEALAALDDQSISVELIKVWFQARLLKLAGYMPNLVTDRQGNDLNENKMYGFDTDSVVFQEQPNGSFTATHIKALRLLFSQNSPEKLSSINGLENAIAAVSLLVCDLYRLHIGR